MAQSPSTDLAIARLEAALEAMCGAVVVLGSNRFRATDLADEVRVVHGQLMVTLREIRGAMDELAHLRNESVSIGALGFVVGSEHVGERRRSNPPAA